MSDEPATLTVDEASALVDDDIAYWLANPFMSPELLAQKVCWWIDKAVAAEQQTIGVLTAELERVDHQNCGCISVTLPQSSSRP